MKRIQKILFVSMTSCCLFNCSSGEIEAKTCPPTTINVEVKFPELAESTYVSSSETDKEEQVKTKKIEICLGGKLALKNIANNTAYNFDYCDSGRIYSEYYTAVSYDFEDKIYSVEKLPVGYVANSVSDHLHLILTIEDK